MKALCLRFDAELNADQRIGTNSVYGTPQCKQLVGSHKDAGLLKEVTRETCPAQHSGNGDSQLLQLYGEASWNSEVFKHPLLLFQPYRSCPADAMQEASKELRKASRSGLEIVVIRRDIVVSGRANPSRRGLVLRSSWGDEATGQLPDPDERLKVHAQFRR
jgi:hypothetical protein